MDESRLLRSPDVMIAEGPDRAAEPLVPLRRSAATGRPPVPLINAVQNADLRAGDRCGGPERGPILTTIIAWADADMEAIVIFGSRIREVGVFL